MRTRMLLPVVLVLGCGGLTVPEGTPAVEGTVVLFSSMAVPDGTTPSVGIRLERQNPPCNDITVIAVIDGDRFVKQLPDGSLEEAAFADLAEGQTVRAWLSAQIDCPFIGTADVVEIEVQ